MKILLAGDSTVANCPTEEYPMSGWGAELPRHVFTWTAVHNFAKGGASTESFREEGLWGGLRVITEAGDAVVLQFGHNDQKLGHLGATTGYTDNLKRMISGGRERGAQVVLCTSVERRNFVEGAKQATLTDYANAVRLLSDEEQLPHIDLSAWTTDLYVTAGETGSTA
ncbi:GDSL-type esterase/lipase family protein [Arthrobacter psychrolactophilus]